MWLFVFRRAVLYTRCSCRTVGKRAGVCGFYSGGARKGSPPRPWEKKERVVGFLSGGGICVAPSYEPVVHPGVIPIS